MLINIVGDGSAGQRHARMLRARGHVCTVLGPADASPATHPPCDAVVIASPPLTHMLYLSWYWNRAHILCEGPVTWDVPHSAYTHMLAENWLFVPAIRDLHTSPPAVVTARLHFDYDLARWRPQPWDYRTSCYYTDGIDHINAHEVAIAIYLFGSVERVSIHTTRTGKSLGVDAFAMCITHASGTLTTITSSWHCAQYQRSLEFTRVDGTHEHLSWTTPTDDAVVNQSYEDMLDCWLAARTPSPSLALGYRAWRALQGEPA